MVFECFGEFSLDKPVQSSCESAQRAACPAEQAERAKRDRAKLWNLPVDEDPQQDR